MIKYFIIAGSREYEDYNEFERILNQLFLDYDLSTLHIISGGARGADKMAERYCREYKIRNIIFNAEWDKYKKPFTRFNPAGFIRNRKMHEFMCKHADFNNRGCICFWDGDGRGTSNNFELCKEFGTNFVVYDWVKHEFLNPYKVKGYKYKA